MAYQINDNMGEEARIVFIEVIKESLRVKIKTDLFNWLQRGIQYLIGHDVFVYGVRGSESELFQFNYFTTTLEFTDAQFQEVTEKDTGLIYQAYKNWQINSMPVFVNSDLPNKEHENYNVLNISQGDMLASKLNQFVLHGYGDNNSRISSIVIFGRMNGPVNDYTSCLLQLLMPYFHCALIKVFANGGIKQLYENQRSMVKPITRREIEVLQWLYTGKTNWEIALILGISHTTVKNHVQNIIRKLGVENRRQAGIKALRLGFISSPLS
jgi:transcriptional regulator EpsA